MKKLLKYSAAIAVAGMVASTASAHTIASLSNGIANAGEFGVDQLAIGDKIFADFSWIVATGPGVDATGVTVTVGQAGSDYFIDFGGAIFTVSVADFNLRYTVRTSSGLPLIAAIDQSFNLSSGGAGGSVSIGETVFDAGFGVGNAVAQSTVGFFIVGDISDPPGEIVQGDQLIINPPLNKIWITKDILLVANQGGLVAATLIHQSFHQVGVPDGGSTLMLLGAALSGLSIIGLRNRKDSR